MLGDSCEVALVLNCSSSNSKDRSEEVLLAIINVASVTDVWELSVTEIKSVACLLRAKSISTGWI